MAKPLGRSQTQAEYFLAQRKARLEYLRKLQEGAEDKANRLSTETVYTALKIEPNPGPQSVFLSLPDDNLDVFYGGAAGGGKSFALFAYTLRACAKWPGLQAFWFRRTFPELEHSVLRMLARFNYAKAIGGTWNDGKKELRFSNGSILTFLHAKNIQEATALHSAEINLLILDERTTIPPDVVDLLYIRVRSGVEGVPCLGVRSASNPGGPGHGRVRLEYVEATDYGQNTFLDKNGRTRIFIQAKVTDTPQLAGDYVAALDGLPEELRRAFKDGDWSVFSGQCFTELKRDRHLVKPFPIPGSWRRYAGIDWGWAAPWAVVWGALDEDGRIWIYRERYEAKIRESDQAKNILSDERDEDVTGRFADDAMWASRGEARTIADMYEDEGCHIEKAGKGTGSRLAGKARIHSYLADAPACRMHQDMGWETCPKLHIFSTCTNLYRELENLPYATTGNVEDTDPKADDHAYDALRYLLTNIGNEPRWYFLEEGENIQLVSEDDLHRPPRTPVPMIGGYPILEGNSPWGF
jgi:hypothetical protein